MKFINNLTRFFFAKALELKDSRQYGILQICQDSAHNILLTLYTQTIDKGIQKYNYQVYTNLYSNHLLIYFIIKLYRKGKKLQTRDT